MKEIEILKDRGFNPITDLPFCLSNGAEYYIGYCNKIAGIVSLMPENESIYFLDKIDLLKMAETAMIKGVEQAYLYTNYGVEIHSKYENPQSVNMAKIIKIDKQGYNHN